MATAQIKAGENILIKLGLFTMADGLTFQGAWDSGTAYVADDVVVNDSVAYKCILANTGQEPPNVTYWEPLPLIDADDVKAITVSLILALDEFRQVRVSWVYVQGQPSPPNLTLVDGLLTLELLSADSATLMGIYDLQYAVTVADVTYSSGGQTDVLCLEDVLEVTPC